MTAEEFVRKLDADNQALLANLAPDATLKPEVEGALNVPNLLKVALKNEVEATEIAARWLVATDDVFVKMAFARQAGDEAKHYRMIAERLRQLGFDPTTIDPLATGFGPLFKYLDGLTTTVERVAAGQFTREDREQDRQGNRVLRVLRATATRRPSGDVMSRTSAPHSWSALSCCGCPPPQTSGGGARASQRSSSSRELPKKALAPPRPSRAGC